MKQHKSLFWEHNRTHLGWPYIFRSHDHF